MLKGAASLAFWTLAAHILLVEHTFVDSGPCACDTPKTAAGTAVASLFFPSSPWSRTALLRCWVPYEYKDEP